MNQDRDVFPDCYFIMLTSKDLAEKMSVIMETLSARIGFDLANSIKPHLTLAGPFMLSDEKIATNAINNLKKIKINLGSVGRFNNGVTYLNASPGLDLLRMRKNILKSLSQDRGFVENTDYNNWTPHVTLWYERTPSWSIDLKHIGFSAILDTVELSENMDIIKSRRL